MRARNSLLSQLRQIWFIFPYLFAISILVLLAYSVQYKIRQPFDGLTWSRISGQVSQVESSSPADDLINPDDKILSVDGMPISEIGPIFAQKKPGDELQFRLLQDGVIRDVRIRLRAAPLPEVGKQLVPTIVGFAFWMIGVIIRSYAPNTLRTWIFFGLCLLVSGILATGSLSSRGPRWASSVFNFLLWWIGPLTVQLHILLQEKPTTRIWRIFLGSSYAFAVLGGLAIVLVGISQLHALDWYVLMYKAGRLHLAINIIAASLFLIVTYFRSESPEIRHRIRFITLFGGLAFLLVVVLSILPNTLFDTPILPYEYSFLFLLLIPLSYGYAIYRHRLFRLERILSRSAAFSLVIVIILSLYLATTAFANRFIITSQEPNSILTLAILMLLAAMFHPLRVRLQRLVDHIFYGGWYDFRSATDDLTQGLDHLTEIETLGEALSQRMRETLRLKYTHVILRNVHGKLIPFPHDGGFAKALRATSTQSEGDLLANDSLLARYFQTHPTLARASSLEAALQSAGTREQGSSLLALLPDSMIYPIQESGVLLGLLMLGPKQAGEIFSTEDQDILEIVSRQVAIAIENIHLVTTLRARAREIDQLHGRILYAREEERKRLARDLHDDVIQDLIALNMSIVHLQGNPSKQLHQEVRSVIHKLREICAELRPATLDTLGLVSAIRSRLRSLQQLEGQALCIEHHVHGIEPADLPEDIAVGLYRFFNEAMHNVLKHAHASKVEVNIHFQPDQIIITVHDNGIGFVVPDSLGIFLSNQHFGIVGLRERLELLSGTLSILSQPGKGTEIKAMVPYQSQNP